MGRTKLSCGIKFLLFVTASLPLPGQVDLSGSWAARNYADAVGNRPGPGPGMVDYAGLPLNEFARERALLYSPSQVSMPDRMCGLYSPVYALIGPFGLKIWNETEPRNGTTMAWKIGAWEDLASMTIWMDGRPHPTKNAPHESSGFTTGVWEDDVLTTYTTHMKAGTFRRNGVPSSDQTTMTAHLFRHGDILTMTARMEDPIYLAEPLYMTRTFQLSSAQPVLSVGNPCIPANEGVPEGAVPHYLPGENPFMNDMMRMYNVPAEAALGGPETMYPEYRKKLKDRYVPPAQCKRDCGGPGGFPLRTN
jgi:hypothetical protein